MLDTASDITAAAPVAVGVIKNFAFVVVAVEAARGKPLNEVVPDTLLNASLAMVVLKAVPVRVIVNAVAGQSDRDIVPSPAPQAPFDETAVMSGTKRMLKVLVAITVAGTTTCTVVAVEAI